MPISLSLQKKFSILETAAFSVWKDANAETREKITKDLGEFEAKEIIREIEEEAARKFPV